MEFFFFFFCCIFILTVFEHWQKKIKKNGAAKLRNAELQNII
jgi:hypothetical protein